jgi:hypothetical protein
MGRAAATNFVLQEEMLLLLLFNRLSLPLTALTRLFFSQRQLTTNQKRKLKVVFDEKLRLLVAAYALSAEVLVAFLVVSTSSPHRTSLFPISVFTICIHQMRPTGYRSNTEYICIML